jgi:hypothetical protein
MSIQDYGRALVLRELGKLARTIHNLNADRGLPALAQRRLHRRGMPLTPKPWPLPRSTDHVQKEAHFGNTAGT